MKNGRDEDPVVPVDLYTQATAGLQKEVEDDLNQPDPTPEEAEAAIKNNK